MQHLTLLADFNVLRPDIGILFWTVIPVMVVAVSVLVWLACRLLSSDSPSRDLRS